MEIHEQDDGAVVGRELVPGTGTAPPDPVPPAAQGIPEIPEGDETMNVSKTRTTKPRQERRQLPSKAAAPKAASPKAAAPKAASPKAASKAESPKGSTANGRGPATRAAKSPAVDDRKFRDAANSFKSVSDPTRLAVIYILSQGEENVTSLCDQVSIGGMPASQPAVSHHLALLRHGGIIEPRRQGKNNVYALTPEKGARLAEFVATMIGGNFA